MRSSNGFLMKTTVSASSPADGQKRWAAQPGQSENSASSAKVVFTTYYKCTRVST